MLRAHPWSSAGEGFPLMLRPKGHPKAEELPGSRVGRSFGESVIRAAGPSPGPAELFSSVLFLSLSRWLTWKNIASLLVTSELLVPTQSAAPLVASGQDSLPRKKHPFWAAMSPSRQLGYFCPVQHSHWSQRKLRMIKQPLHF